MYLHIGKDRILPGGEIVAILDLDTASVGVRTREFLRAAQDAGQVLAVTEELPKSLIVCHSPGKGQVLYVSQLSSQTLLKRAETGGFTLETEPENRAT
jgi:hypothetical protein